MPPEVLRIPVRLNKKPLTRHDLKDATQSEAAIRKFWNRWPNVEIRLNTDGLVVFGRCMSLKFSKREKVSGYYYQGKKNE